MEKGFQLATCWHDCSHHCLREVIIDNLQPLPQHQTYLSRELASPLGAIDIGTNSIRLIIAEPQPDGGYRVLDDEKEATRLGAHLAATGLLDPLAVERTLETLSRMKSIADGFQTSELRTIATCAVREAADGQQFCQRVGQEVGLNVEVISAVEEGRLSFLSVQRNFDLRPLDVAVADIGGGSTEVVMASGAIIEEIYSTPLGAVRLTEILGGKIPALVSGGALSTADLGAFSKWIDEILVEKIPQPPFRPHVLFGTGGTFTTLAAILLAREGQADLPLKGYVARRADVSHLVDWLGGQSLKRRRNTAGLSSDRADIIVSGLTIVDRLMKHLSVNRLQVHTGGVRDGLLLQMVDDRLASASAPYPMRSGTLSRLDAARRFARTCGVDLRHSEHVAKLASDIYRQMAELGLVDPADTPLLEVAALLQDVGYLVNYEDHHKHSYHLILNSNLAGLQPQELQLVAQVARYHRGSQPKTKHEPFKQLSAADRTRVRRMAAVLRVAIGLDRSHTQQVQTVTILKNGGELDLALFAKSEPEVDLWAVRRRAELLESVFEVNLRPRWAGPPSLLPKGD